MSKSNKKQKLKFIDGKLPEERNQKAEKKKYNSYDELFGYQGEGVYHTKNVDEYEEYLNSLPITDLQLHATKFNLFPVNERHLLVNRCIAEFQKHWAQFDVPTLPTSKNEGKIPKELANLLAKVR